MGALPPQRNFFFWKHHRELSQPEHSQFVKFMDENTTQDAEDENTKDMPDGYVPPMSVTKERTSERLVQVAVSHVLPQHGLPGGEAGHVGL